MDNIPAPPKGKIDCKMNVYKAIGATFYGHSM